MCGIANNKLNLTQTELGDWILITSKLSDKWRHLLDEDKDTTHPCQWIRLYVWEEEDHVFVVQIANEFFLLNDNYKGYLFSLRAQYFTVGTYSRCINEWEKPSGTMEGCFHEVKIIHTSRGPKEAKEEDRLTITFFYGKRPRLDGTWTGRGGRTVNDFLITQPKWEGTQWFIGIRRSPGRRRSDKVIFQIIVDSNGPKYRIHYNLVKKRPSFGVFSIKRWRLMSGELELHRPQFPNNARFVCPILMNQFNTSFGIVSKQGGLGGGLPSSCTSFVELIPVIMIASIRSKFSLEKWFGKISPRKLKCGTYFEVSRFGPFGLSAMTTFSTASIGMNSRSNIGFEMNWLSMPKPRGTKSSRKLRVVDSRLWPCLGNLILLGG